MEDFINKLNIPFEGRYQGRDYIITLDNSNDFSTAFTAISTNDDLNLEEGSITTPGNAMYIYISDYFEIRITADFDKDIYRLQVSER